MDTTLFIKESNDHFLLVQVYVDDIVSGSANITLCEDFGKLITNEFDMSMMRELTFFLGLQIKQTPTGIFVHQGKYAKELVKKFDLKNSKPMSTPMHPNTKIDKDENGKDVDENWYRGMIGSLMYLTSTRPDIVQSILRVIVWLEEALWGCVVFLDNL
ncbi:uncharacterized mitochondrial protein AtMg00810-like [Arachis hypogaea]|uniref:uncharacterized mitochondrial protein AtMg00810-like n=1 Tax=Arachis hypogaea TaxID=3818 RepID=UPI000DECB8CF|nr:uncharacterized protein LOC112748306 [Arachis hypogaea]